MPQIVAFPSSATGAWFAECAECLAIGIASDEAGIRETVQAHLAWHRDETEGNA